jgi:hypothetical protein
MSGTRVRGVTPQHFWLKVTAKKEKRGARDEGEVEGEVLDLPPVTSENDERCSGGETRTLNLAVNSRLLCH